MDAGTPHPQTFCSPDLLGVWAGEESRGDVLNIGCHDSEEVIFLARAAPRVALPRPGCSWQLLGKVRLEFSCLSDRKMPGRLVLSPGAAETCLYLYLTYYIIIIHMYLHVQALDRFFCYNNDTNFLFFYTCSVLMLLNCFVLLKIKSASQTVGSPRCPLAAMLADKLRLGLGGAAACLKIILICLRPIWHEFKFLDFVSGVTGEIIFSFISLAFLLLFCMVVTSEVRVRISYFNNKS